MKNCKGPFGDRIRVPYRRSEQDTVRCVYFTFTIRLLGDVTHHVDDKYVPKLRRV